jgi:hypothetical protein
MSIIYCGETPRQKVKREAEASGAHIRQERRERVDYGQRPAAEVRELRKLAAGTASVCADCFAPLKPGASVTLVMRSMLAKETYWPRNARRAREREKYVLVPICLVCWLIEVQREAEATARRWRWCADAIHELESKAAGGAEGLWRLERLRCMGCGRPMRLYRPRYARRRTLHLSERVCCADCERLVANRRNNERRRVHHGEIVCEACGVRFVPTRADAKACSNRCRQRLHRQRTAA